MKIRALLFGLGIWVGLARVGEAQPPIPVAVEAKPQADFDVILAAPAVVSVTRSPVVPISVVVERRTRKPLPKLSISASNGLFCKLVTNKPQNNPFQSGDIELDGSQPESQILVSLLTSGTADDFRVSVYATDGDGAAREVATQKIKILRPAKIEFEQVPAEIKADGKSTGSIRFRALDQHGNPLPDAQFFIRYRDLNNEFHIVQSALTDGQGKASFQLPASTQGRHLLPQLTFVSTQTVRSSEQFDIIYRTASNANEKPAVPNPFWWKKGWNIEE